VLDRGRIAERGRHDELVAHSGLYATLYKRQLLEEELAAS
jgi:ABC-type multidrug transport system fused ATPase/permease subunit